MNPHDINWPTDPSGITTDLQKHGVLVAQRLFDAAQLKAYLGCLSELAKYAKAATADREAEIAQRVRFAAEQSKREAEQNAAAELRLAQARLAALGDVEEAQAKLAAAQAAVDALSGEDASKGKGKK